MAQKIEITFTDDIDGSAAEGTVAFSLEGKSYEIDLSAKNRGSKLEKAFQPYVDVARRASTGTRRRSSANGSAPKRHDQSAVRAWGIENGFKVSNRGRIPAEVTTAYEAAH